MGRSSRLTRRARCVAVWQLHRAWLAPKYLPPVEVVVVAMPISRRLNQLAAASTAHTLGRHERRNHPPAGPMHRPYPRWLVDGRTLNLTPDPAQSGPPASFAPIGERNGTARYRTNGGLKNTGSLGRDPGVCQCSEMSPEHVLWQDEGDARMKRPCWDQELAAKRTCGRPWALIVSMFAIPIRSATRIEASFSASTAATIRGAPRCRSPAARQAAAASVAYPRPQESRASVYPDSMSPVGSKMPKPTSPITRSFSRSTTSPGTKAATLLRSRVSLQRRLDGSVVSKRTAWDEAHYFRIAIDLHHRSAVGAGDERADEQACGLDRERDHAHCLRRA